MRATGTSKSTEIVRRILRIVIPVKEGEKNNFEDGNPCERVVASMAESREKCLYYFPEGLIWLDYNRSSFFPTLMVHLFNLSTTK